MKKMTTINNAVKRILDAGGYVEIGKVSICDVSVFLQSRERFENRFQVISEDHRFPYSNIYVKDKVAIDKFVAILRYLDECRN